ncbi:hypothetical protein IR148_00620 [Dysgonomonas mossii]|uniref:Phage tail protein n=1 Tax=Dysgonomonas mossii TaxID=163665 RepID=A0A4Y9IQ95_9BACT|nr:hypothetical protein [Dysgonomonas mossii]MBF0759545.1 hypothetical protein [Dysgonomonas mossii]TFU90511.1 hypothetical protein E4T88_00615 [Dysgonomonas mossii]
MATTPVKHDANTDIVRGQLFLFLNNLPLAFAKSASMQLAVAEIDASNKMMGDWDVPFPGNKSFTLSSESLLSKAEGQLSYAAMLDMVISGEPVDFYFGEAKKTEATTTGGKYEPDLTKKHYTGKAMFTQLDLQSSNGELASCSASLKGVGALTPVEGVPAGG